MNVFKTLVACATFVLCSCASEKLTVKRWSHPASSIEVEYMERMSRKYEDLKDAKSSIPQVPSPALDYAGPVADSFKKLFNRTEDIGLCFSGGGTRSATATLGELKGLSLIQYKGKSLMDSVRYISCVSGGSWCVIPYCYNTAFTDEEFWGKPLAPDELKVSAIRKKDTYGIMGSSVCNSSVTGKMLRNWFMLRGDESYAFVLNQVFLAPLKLDANKYFTWDAAVRDEIVKRNSKVLTTNDFYMIRKDRPYYIVNTCLKTPTKKSTSPYKNIPWEITPAYVGSLQTYNFAGGAQRHWWINPMRHIGQKNTPVGGGFIEPLGFDTKYDADETFRLDTWDNLLVVKTGYNWMPGVRPRFTLADAIACSGAAPSYHYWIGQTLGFPEFKTFPLELDNPKNYPAEEFLFGDGGFTDNSGVMALLRRKVETVVMFCNAEAPFNPLASEGLEVDSYLSSLFSVNPDINFTQHFNHVFPKELYASMIKEFNTDYLKGEPLLWSTNNVQVANNLQFDVKSYNCNLVVYYLGPYTYRSSDKNKWLDKLGAHKMYTPDIHARLNNFPHLATFMENSDGVTRYKPPQVNLLANMTEFQMKDVAVEIQKAVSNPPIQDRAEEFNFYEWRLK